MDDSRFYNVAEVAKIFGYNHRSTISRKAQSGELKAIRIGEKGHWRFEKDYIDGLESSTYSFNSGKNQIVTTINNEPKITAIGEDTTITISN